MRCGHAGTLWGDEPTPDALVFPSQAGTELDAHNVRRAFRTVSPPQTDPRTGLLANSATRSSLCCPTVECLSSRSPDFSVTAVDRRSPSACTAIRSARSWRTVPRQWTKCSAVDEIPPQCGDHPSQRVDPRAGLHRQPGRRQQLLARRAEQVTHHHLHAGTWPTPRGPGLEVDRSPTNFARYRTSHAAPDRGGAIHASGSRPSRNRSARSRRHVRRSSPAATRTSSPPTGAPDAPGAQLREAYRQPSTSRTSLPTPPPGASPARAITCRR